MDPINNIKNEAETSITLLENELLSEEFSNSEIAEDPLVEVKQSSTPELLNTNTAKFAYAQEIVKEVIKRVPILSDSQEDEKRILYKLRIRMMRIKNRILKDIKIPTVSQEEARQNAKAKRHQKYKKMIAKETPEETALRRKREAELRSYHRSVKKELDLPEILLEKRMASIKKRQELKAKETPEERAARKEQTKNYRLKLKEKKQDTDDAKSKAIFCPKTGKMYDQSEKRRRGRSCNDNKMAD